jgi:hypothetical protein
MVRTTVEEEKRRWIEELRAAQDDVCRLRIELAHAKEKAKMSGGRREASKSIDVYADEESDEDASSSDSDARLRIHLFRSIMRQDVVPSLTRASRTSTIIEW